MREDLDAKHIDTWFEWDLLIYSLTTTTSFLFSTLNRVAFYILFTIHDVFTLGFLVNIYFF